MSPEERMKKHLSFLYGERQAERVFDRLQEIMRKYASLLYHTMFNQASRALSEGDVILITYGDHVVTERQSPLRTLENFLKDYLQDVVSSVHILPFYPYSSDDGFSVIDYRQVDPRLGSWEDIANIGQKFRLMFDAVINHVSQHSQWFRAFVEGDTRYQGYFITVDPALDLSGVVRPRALPLLTEVDTASGRKHVWTTFSEDQIDLNYANPHVLIEILDLLLYYAWRGAKYIRLDAIAYLWKEIGTPCIHLPQTHAVVKLMRAVLDLAAPHVLLITETNVPHEENISYFGTVDLETGLTDEAQLVYQFPLAPLVLNAFQRGNAETLSRWADSLEAQAIFLNFIASHDGIGVMPARGLLSEDEIQALVDQTLRHGGQVSYKSNPDGSRSVYELNITLYDVLNDPASPSPDVDTARFLASQAIMLSLAGVPGIYLHSLVGARNCYQCIQDTGRARSINREKFDYRLLKAELEQGNSHRARVFSAYRRLLVARRQQPAFHPFGTQKVLFLDPAVFALLRISPGGEQWVLCLINVSSVQRNCSLDLAAHGLPTHGDWQDIVNRQRFQPERSTLTVPLAPYQTRWLAQIARKG